MAAFETRFTDDDWDWEAGDAPTMTEAAVMHVQRYVLETDAFEITEQPFKDVVAVREKDRPQSVRHILVSGEIKWMAMTLDRSERS